VKFKLVFNDSNVVVKQNELVGSLVSSDDASGSILTNYSSNIIDKCKIEKLENYEEAKIKKEPENNSECCFDPYNLNKWTSMKTLNVSNYS